MSYGKAIPASVIEEWASILNLEMTQVFEYSDLGLQEAKALQRDLQSARRVAQLAGHIQGFRLLIERTFSGGVHHIHIRKAIPFKRRIISLDEDGNLESQELT